MKEKNGMHIDAIVKYRTLIPFILRIFNFPMLFNKKGVVATITITPRALQRRKYINSPLLMKNPVIIINALYMMNKISSILYL